MRVSYKIFRHLSLLFKSLLVVKHVPRHVLDAVMWIHLKREEIESDPGN